MHPDMYRVHKEGALRQLGDLLTFDVLYNVRMPHGPGSAPY